MKKKLILFLLTLLTAISSNSQVLRNVKGSKGFDLTAHYTRYGKAFSIGIIQNIQDKICIKGKVNYETGKIINTNYNCLLIMPSGNYNILNLKSFFYVDAEIGGFTGLEKASNKDFKIDEQVLIYGGFFGGEAKIFIKNTAVLFNFYELLTFKSNFGKYRYQAGVGLRFYF